MITIQELRNQPQISGCTDDSFEEDRHIQVRTPNKVARPTNLWPEVRKEVRELCKRLYFFPVEAIEFGEDPKKKRVPIDSVGRLAFGAPGKSGIVKWDSSAFDGFILDQSRLKKYPIGIQDAIYELAFVSRIALTSAEGKELHIGDVLQAAIFVSNWEFPYTDLYKRAAFAAAMQSAVCGTSRGLGGPSAREILAVQWIISDNDVRDNTFARVGKILSDPHGAIFGGIGPDHMHFYEECDTLDDSPEDIQKMKGGNKG